MYKKILLIFFCFVQFVTVTSQTNSAKPKSKLIKILHADDLSFDNEKNDSKVLSGNVKCEHEGTLLFCDTAFINDQENSMRARGHIIIIKGDSIRITGDLLDYNGKTKMAVIQNNVKCVEKDMTLTTNYLTFDVGNSIAHYSNGGKIVNKQNTLVSKNGHYYSSTKEAAFHYDAVLTNPEYKMNSDTLRYKVNTKTVYFLGPSIILSKQDYIYCENGWYNTEKDKAQFSKNAILKTEQQKLKGDSLIYDRKLKLGKAFKNITLIDTAQKSTLYGDYIEYKEQGSEAFATKRAVYARLVETDSIYISADTIYHKAIDSTNNFITAFHHVKLFKADMQAMCDSATLSTKDSLVQLFNSPTLWSNNSQATAKNIKIEIGKKEIKGFVLDGKAFLIQQLDSLNKTKFNQLSGKKIIAKIITDTIRKADILGNAEVYYYPKNKNKAVGLNKTNSQDIFLWFSKGEISRVSMRPKSTGIVDPIKDLDVENSKIKGFNWRYDSRPKSRFEIVIK